MTDRMPVSSVSSLYLKSSTDSLHQEKIVSNNGDHQQEYNESSSTNNGSILMVTSNSTPRKTTQVKLTVKNYVENIL